ncbi:ras-like protein family member 10B [Macrosteles quadrilineatus]|uniref:ras-like protein family member 10B n=1 Tax=Macrosteles quadrilineatus TaxID=74068 RepID=UPI0023E2B561|nr:ras-like protein family member 10B [Macrosteles quadrilineatus]
MEIMDDNKDRTIQLERHSLELNLDYLEGGRVCSPCTPISLPQLSPDTPELVKLVLLGAPGVGKTSIVQQFVWNSFVQDYAPTDSRHTYYPTVIVNGRVYELKITDLPAVPYFPVSSVYELRDCPLRDATAYMMVLDLSDLDTFRYLETVREQILESRDSLPGLVVGNKVDLLNTRDDASLARRRDVMDRVKTLWGCEYAECSARYSSLVSHVFRQLMEAVDREETNASSNPCPMDAFGGSKCSML